MKQSCLGAESSQAGCPILALPFIFTNPWRPKQLDGASHVVAHCASSSVALAVCPRASCVTMAGGEGREENSPKEGCVCFIYILFFFNSQGSCRVAGLPRDFCVIAWKKPHLTPCLPWGCCCFVPTRVKPHVHPVPTPGFSLKPLGLQGEFPALGSAGEHGEGSPGCLCRAGTPEVDD